VRVRGRPECGSPTRVPAGGGWGGEDDRGDPEWCWEVARFLKR